MEDSCYICRRTQTDLDRLNEEVRTRVYLSYFSNARAQIDDERRKITFLQRLKDEESGDPHFRINAKQVFGDPRAYEKLMPWIDTLIEIVRSGQRRVDESRSIGELVEELLVAERHDASRMEEGLNQIRAGFATGGKFPLHLEKVAYSFPVEWSVEGSGVSWRSSNPDDREPLERAAGEPKSVVEFPVHICTVCREITRHR